ncbi:MAG: hypothetical protein KME60_22365 [Cyanomargarita calcarea GSE-NOS-MK-12-04C]|uniref:Uncharacterized protein n=1 Tax=Cyanomargarita calcarea GSE-NOS-MK-12-04C TaxID=2839659 RepID=A0A951UTU4_9CYAN|nr:hypothetical protein [Cyanomargarita calcarea GSE-NOS-MK-12-04C]
MKLKIIAALGMISAIAGLNTPVRGQSPAPATPNSGQYTITGGSLTGIDNRTAQDDFGKFFTVGSPASTVGNNTGETITSDTGVWQLGESVQLRKLDQPLTLIDTPLLLQPAQSVNGNDGLQLQLIGQ